MKTILAFAIAIFTGLTFYTDAQQVVKIDTLSGTELILTMDQKTLNDLDELEEKCVKISNNKKNQINRDYDSSYSNPTKTKILVPNRELTKAEICRRNPRILGFKIQLNTVKSNEEANEVKAFFRRRFPDLKVETDASLRPNYKILAGSYFSKESANSDLRRIRGTFKNAIAVQYRIFCAEAK